jgi:hypothetical protein
MTDEVSDERKDEEEKETEHEPDTPMLHEPTPADIQRECRYSVIMTVPPSNEPWKAFVELLRKFMKLIHDQASNKIHISTWDPELKETEKRIKKPKDFPKTGSILRTILVAIPTPKKEKPPRYT